MKVNFDCIPCTVQSCLRLVDTDIVPQDQREMLLRHTLRFLADVDYDQSPPALAQQMHRIFREVLDNPDPYRDIKQASNELMLGMADKLRQQVRTAADPLAAAIRLAIAGNVIDFGARNLYEPTETIAAVLDAELGIDHINELANDLAQAQSVLYIGDNTGEIVADAILLETLDHPNVTFVVRGAPIINDATLEDAQLVGIDKLARVITTGDDAPGVIWESSSVEFQQAFTEADLVISKGQGNLEGLIDQERQIYFLLTTKCGRIADQLTVDEKSFVVWRKEAGK